MKVPESTIRPNSLKMSRFQRPARVLVSLLLCFAASLHFNARVSTAANESVAPHGKFTATLTVAMDRNTIDYFLYKATPTGMQLELTQRFAAHLGRTIEVFAVDSQQEGIEAVQNGAVDFYATSDSLTLDHPTLLSCSLHSQPSSANRMGEKLATWLFPAEKSSLMAVATEWFSSKGCVRLNRALTRKFGTNGYMRQHFQTADGNSPLSAYDSLIKVATRDTRWDWRWVASIIYQESRFKPSLHSHRGAYGLMQMTPATARHFDVPHLNTPKAQIDAGVNYLLWLDSQFEKNGIPDELRNDFILAAYNAGYSRIRTAQGAASALGYSPAVWVGNVAIAHAKTPQRVINSNPLTVLYGTGETCNFVREINCRYTHYKNLL